MDYILRVNGRIKTGGPKAIFQLAECLGSFGRNVIICYDDEKSAEFFSDWSIYYFKSKALYLLLDNIGNIKNSVIILPESSLDEIKLFSINNKIWIYMLSLDNCLSFGVSTPTMDSKIRHFKNKILSIPKSIINKWAKVSKKIDLVLSQSSYANNFLSKSKYPIPYLYIGDFIDSDFNFKLANTPNKMISSKLKVSYNPSKGRLLFLIVRLLNKRITFIPIINIKPQDIGLFLVKTDCYVDFGGQPGKDRLPREALRAGIPSFQFERGAAINGTDFPCHTAYRLGIVDIFLFENKILNGLKMNSQVNFASRIAEVSSEKTIFYAKIEYLLKGLGDRYE